MCRRLLKYKKVLGIILMSVLLISCSNYKVLKENSEEGFEYVVFSKETGIYDEEFFLTLRAPAGWNIYYTLDGSDPSEDSVLYEDKIYIGDASKNKNVYSMRKDVSAGFLTDEIAQYSHSDPMYESPFYLIDKCNVVRAVAVSPENKCSKTMTKVYFVDFERKRAYNNLAILSIVTDPANLFDYEKGIYVTGKTYDDYVNSGRGQWYDEYWWWWPGNYSQKGRDSEREAHIDYFDNTHELVLSKEIGIRVKGGGSRGRVPRSFNLYAREEYDGEKKFKSDIFGSGYKPRKITLFSGADDINSKMKDYLVNDLCKDLQFSTMDFIPCAMFLDGEYWGVYYITEKYDKKYVQFHFDVDDDEVIIIKNGEIEEGKDEDINLYTEMKSFISQNDMSVPDNYSKACEMIDINSFIDYYAVQAYISRYNDWPSGNFALWRTRNKGSGYGDGRWRWMIFDVNSGGIIETHIEFDSIKYILDNDPMFNSLWANNEFKTKFCIRLKEIGKTVFGSNRINNFINRYSDLMEIPSYEDKNRFLGGNFNNNEFDLSVGAVKTFFEKRFEYVDSLTDAYLN